MKKQMMDERIFDGGEAANDKEDVLDLLVTCDMLLEAGIDPGDEFEIFCEEGEVIIRQRAIFERLPEEVQERLNATGLSEDVLEMALREEAREAGGFESLLEKLQRGSF